MASVPELFLNHSVQKLDQMTNSILLCLSKLDEEQIWRRNGSNENAIGNLVLHLCGNVRQWIGFSIGGDEDVRNRPAEFAATELSAPELESKLRQTIDYATGILQRFSAERLGESVTTQSGPSTALETIYHVVGHFQQHAGQIIFATKQFTGQDLQIYRP